MEQQLRKLLLTAVVVTLSAVSFSTLYSTTSNYVETTKATHRLGGNLVNLEIVSPSTLNFTFHFSNTSTITVTLQKIAFNVYANGTFLGNFDMREPTLIPPGEIDVTVKAEVHPFYLGDLTSELEESQKIIWFIKGGSVIELPFGQITVSLPVEEYWVT